MFVLVRFCLFHGIFTVYFMKILLYLLYSFVIVFLHKLHEDFCCACFWQYSIAFFRKIQQCVFLWNSTVPFYEISVVTVLWEVYLFPFHEILGVFFMNMLLDMFHENFVCFMKILLFFENCIVSVSWKFGYLLSWNSWSTCIMKTHTICFMNIVLYQCNENFVIFYEKSVVPVPWKFVVSISRKFYGVCFREVPMDTKYTGRKRRTLASRRWWGCLWLYSD